MFLLSQFRETRAYPLIIELLSAPPDIPYLLLGDSLTEHACRMLASLFDGNLQPLMTLAENADADDFARSAALDALVILVAQGIVPQDEVVAYFESLFRGRLPRKHDFIWSALVSDALHLSPDTLFEDMQQAFADDLIDPMYIDMKFVDLQMQRGRDALLEEFASDRHRTLITDTIGELEKWYAFRPEEVPSLSQTPYFAPVFNPTTVVRAEPKVGRNDPCPCGSGKKYKKCHGKRGTQMND